MSSNSFVSGGVVVELSNEEMMAVFGGAGSVPVSTSPGTCPSGTTVSSATYNSSGQLTSLTCTPTVTTQSVQQSASVVGQIVEVAKDLWNAL